MKKLKDPWNSFNIIVISLYFSALYLCIKRVAFLPHPVGIYPCATKEETSLCIHDSGLCILFRGPFHARAAAIMRLTSSFQIVFGCERDHFLTPYFPGEKYVRCNMGAIINKNPPFSP